MISTYKVETLVAFADDTNSFGTSTFITALPDSHLIGLPQGR